MREQGEISWPGMTTVQYRSHKRRASSSTGRIRAPFPRATVPRHAPTQTERAGVRPHPPASKSKNREPLRPPQRVGAQPEPRAAAWGRTHAQEFLAARAYPHAIHRDRRGAHARSRVRGGKPDRLGRDWYTEPSHDAGRPHAPHMPRRIQRRLAWPTPPGGVKRYASRSQVRAVLEARARSATTSSSSTPCPLR